MTVRGLRPLPAHVVRTAALEGPPVSGCLAIRERSGFEDRGRNGVGLGGSRREPNGPNHGRSRRRPVGTIFPAILLPCLLVLWPLSSTAAPGLIITVHDDGAAARLQAPVSVEVKLPKSLQAAAEAGRLCLREVTPDGSRPAPVPAQFEPEATGADRGRLYWLMPPRPSRPAEPSGQPDLRSGGEGKRRFALTAAGGPAAAAVTARRSDDDSYVEISEGGTPVLRYNFLAVPVPKGVGGRYAVARSDYIHPLHGPAGEVLTTDYAKGHPHHRGLYWAWPEVDYKGQCRDLHALQGVFARPVEILRVESGPVCATISAASEWLWGNTEPIVAEVATVRAYANSRAGRTIDLEFRFTALVDDVKLARRGRKLYGGFNLRFSARGGQKLVQYVDPAGASPVRSWGQILGVPPGGKEPVGVAIIQHRANPHYPGDWVSYPKLNWLQPTFPAKGVKYELAKGRALVLRYRLWIRAGASDEKALADMWRTYNRPAAAGAGR